MKPLVSSSVALVTFLACALNAAPTYAQAPAVVPSAASPAAPAPDMTKDAKPTAKVARDQCRAEIGAQGLKGEAKRKAVSACLVEKRPDLAEREHCRMDGKDHGLDKAGLKAFVKDCMKAKG